MENKLTVSPSPHFFSGNSTQKIMLRVLIALAPCVIASTVIFGWRALLLVAFCAASCVLLEWLSRKIMKRDNTILDLSAVVTGVILALTLPVGIGLHLAFVGCVVAIVITKQCFGGIGMNFINPAIAGRVVMLVSFPSQMSSYSDIDGITSATLLNSEYTGAKDAYLDMLLGNIGGSIGETCKVAILIGFIFLVATKTIKVHTTVAYVCTVAIFAFAVGGDPLYHILTGGVLFGAVYMATDYTTSPLTDSGKLIFGIGCGVITMVIRLWASLPEGASYSIMLMNILVPYIEKLTKPRPYGYVKGGKR